MLKKILTIIEHKAVQICCHWNTDSLCGAALLYHLLKDKAEFISTTTKGIPFEIDPTDIKQSTEIIICVGIKPSPDLLALNCFTIYIDNHPNENGNLFQINLHDINAPSTSILVYERLLKGTVTPYYMFLALLGYFSNGGDRDTIPQEILKEAKTLIPDYLEIIEGKTRYYLAIERYVSLLNAGKRWDNSGDIPLELLKNIETPEPLTELRHPLAKELEHMRKKLHEKYTQRITIKNTETLDYAIINEEKNIQGVLAANYMSKKPFLIINTFTEPIYSTLHVPKNWNQDAGKLIESLGKESQSFVGGGQERIAGMTIHKTELKEFLERL